MTSIAFNVRTGTWSKVLTNHVESQQIIARFITQLMLQSVKNVRAATPYIQTKHVFLAITLTILALNALQPVLNVSTAQVHFQLGVIGGEILLLILMVRVVSQILQLIVESLSVVIIHYALFVRKDISFKMVNVVVVRMIT